MQSFSTDTGVPLQGTEAGEPQDRNVQREKERLYTTTTGKEKVRCFYVAPIQMSIALKKTNTDK